VAPTSHKDVESCGRFCGRLTDATANSTPRNLTTAYDFDISGGIGGDQSAPRRMTPRQRVERWQRVMREALARMDGLRLPDDLDESFYEAWRESLVLAGATDAEIYSLAELFITWAVERTEPGSEERGSQFELITDHLACTKVRICLNQADTLLSVEFPNRPQIQ
jgi:hypothetical protein